MRTAIISSIITVAALVALVITLNYFSQPPGKRQLITREGDFLDFHIRVPLPFAFSGTKSDPNKVVYLNREGATLMGGGDDATRNQASLAGPSESDVVHIPGFRGSATRWDAVVKCVRKAYAPFNVKIVDQRPVEGNYLMVVIGGQPTTMKHHGKASQRASGLAPFNGLPIHNAVVLVFSRALRASLRLTCETAAHEIAHAYGLDHGYDCRDFMTYLGHCGAKRFVDKEVPCGEKNERICKGGRPTQNSFTELAKVLGRSG